ncbi:hypothetical protein EOE16_09120, partial [Campylobacter upsaliensis]|nr:hypothetical protein [Campylobacter upsaliensis]
LKINRCYIIFRITYSFFVITFVFGLIDKQINASDGINISGIMQHILYFFVFCLFSFFYLEVRIGKGF